MIDLRTDTVTRPTPGMRAAIAAAEVGDEQKGEDPTTRALEERVASLLGAQAAVFVPSATMANQIALQLWSRPGDGLVASAGAHLIHSEAGGPAALAGLMVQPIFSADGTFDDIQFTGAVTGEGVEKPRTTLVSIENSHSNAGGTVWAMDRLEQLRSAAPRYGIRIHLDGARLLNAATRTNVSPLSLCAGMDSVTFCLSKGLGCPFGALLAIPAAAAAEARRIKQRLGGAMRQSGMLAAAGLYALDHHVDRIADDHIRARRLADILADTGLVRGPAQTNVVALDATAVYWDREALRLRLADEGVLVSALPRPGMLRAVTHLDVDDRDIEHAGAVITRVLGGNEIRPRP
ncbi:low specificity L-threonine aldolase [Mycolicibacterium sp. OfavD-34-C]|uniref:threonine aldolase family protein n=1 Tax=Mycolicibacterium sp. OfavD-34-C TaxID=2917746 RepID=UPI001EF70D98|nr:GntG family PLP-dependent aldolase [Mycolicibacterium sp. OfavD-34-C]MCG7580418.1 aminotransferase class I/II-fold pyridoxal phosphate-dependent enzyme [Mycolicibacterium sp. OfavD-34-C]